jgi:hypothetical protein
MCWKEHSPGSASAGGTLDGGGCSGALGEEWRGSLRSDLRWRRNGWRHGARAGGKISAEGGVRFIVQGSGEGSWRGNGLAYMTAASDMTFTRRSRELGG